MTKELFFKARGLFDEIELLSAQLDRARRNLQAVSSCDTLALKFCNDIAAVKVCNDIGVPIYKELIEQLQAQLDKTTAAFANL